jgi:threonine aldolase
MKVVYITARRLHDADRRWFGSDNESGAHPSVMAVPAGANEGHQGSFGTDVYSVRLGAVIAAHFGPGAAVFPVVNGG